MCVCVCVCVCMCFHVRVCVLIQWMCRYIYIYIYIYIHIGSICSLIQISLNMIDIFCLHIFLLILSYCRIDFIVFGGD